MDIKKFTDKIKWIIAGVVLISAVNTQGAITDLATEPIVSTGSAQVVLPNLMFVLDDSGSMDDDFMPDWASPSLSFYFWKNSPDYNGLAYNPATYYRPPIMYTLSGALDTTTYPSQTGMSAATGADVSYPLPNWKKVKNDGYGVQSNAFSDLVGKAIFYNIVAGEYCATPQLRHCTTASVPSTDYPFKAALRWCNTNAQAIGPTSGAENVCQASQIASTPTNISNAVTSYTFARAPALGSIATIVFSGSGEVKITAITVDSQNILSAPVNGDFSSNPDDYTALFKSLVEKINACTTHITGSCTVAGYSAGTDNLTTLLLASPTQISVTPILVQTLTGAQAATTTVGAFSHNVPGSILKTEIKSSITSYPYPGTTIKAPSRTDCASSTCTYEEEMTNYANWWAYYHTRMQTMKTSASLAFSTVTEQFRVGYFSINNATGSDYLDINTFDAAHKYAWYSKFFSAYPNGPTPLRTALSYAGQLYGGKRNSINNQAATDPMQYYCQQNFTLLSTDGYWNDAVNPKRLDLSTDIGQQDGYDIRPYYDGAMQNRISTQTLRTVKQVGENTSIVKTRTIQLQESRQRLDKLVENVLVVPYQVETSQLETRTNSLSKTTYPLIQTKTFLNETTYKMRQAVSYLQKTEYPLQQTTRRLTVRTYPLQKTTTYLQQTEYDLKQTARKLTVKTLPLQKTTTYLQKTEFPLIQTQQKITATRYYVQKRTSVSTNGGDTFGAYSEWQNVGENVVCTPDPVGTPGGGVITRTQCRYSSAEIQTDLTSCTSADPGAYNGTITNCAYQTAVTSTVTSCSIKNGTSSIANTIEDKVTSCEYSSTGTTTNTDACTAQQSSSSPYVGPKRTCAYGGASTTTVSSGSCTVDANGALVGGVMTKTSCSYSGTASSTTTGQNSCTPSASSGNAHGTVWSINPSIACSYDSSTSTSTVTSCTTKGKDTSGTYTPEITACAYSTTASSGPTNVASCSAQESSSSPYVGPKRTCAYGGTSTVTVSSGSCTVDANGTLVGGVMTKTSCSYSGTASSTTTGQNSCTPSASSGNAHGTVWSINPSTACSYDSSTSTSTVTSCTTKGKDTSGTYTPEITACAYSTTASSGPTNVASCSAQESSSSPYVGPKRTCAYGGASTVTVSSGSCKVDANGTLVGGVMTKTSCSYSGTASSTTTGQDSCTPSASSGNAHGTEWTINPSIGCSYDSTTTVTNPSDCTTHAQDTSGAYAPEVSCAYSTTPSSGPTNAAVCVPFASTSSPYTGPKVTCAYGGTVTTDNVLNCDPGAGTAGSIPTQTVCSYMTTGTTVNKVSSCTPVAQDTVNYNVPQKTCWYSAVGDGITEVTTVTSCSPRAQSTSPYVDYAISCAYDTSNPSSKTVSNQSTCSPQAQSSSGATTLIGPAVACAYQGYTSWSSASAACTPSVIAATSDATWNRGVECRYTSPVTSNADTCIEVPANNTNLTAKHCILGPHTYVTVNTAESGIVEECTPGTTTPVAANPGQSSVRTTCAYRTAQAPSNVAACTPHAADTIANGVQASSVVVCSTTDSGFVASASCTPTGTLNNSSYILSTFNSNGQVLLCDTEYPTTNKAVDSCQEDLTGSSPNWIKRTCSTLKLVANEPVLNCTESNTGDTGNNSTAYIKTTCNTVSSNTIVSGCIPEAKTPPNYREVTCTEVPNSGPENTLADVAQYYYKTDLRSAALSNCGADESLCPADIDASKQHQRMITYTLGLGASGFMQYSPTYQSVNRPELTVGSRDYNAVYNGTDVNFVGGTVDEPIPSLLSQGVCNWQSNGVCNWPTPISFDQTGIDDLWHAGVNGRGVYFSAGDPDSLATSLISALASVAAQKGAQGAVATSNPNVYAGDNFIFSTTFVSSDWTGELARYQISPTTGVVTDKPDWGAQARLDTRTSASRLIYTYDNLAANGLKEFTVANYGNSEYFKSPHISTGVEGLSQFLCTSVTVCLSSSSQSAAQGAPLVEYLRGSSANEGAENAKYFRVRQHILGDIVNAESVYVSVPRYGYADARYNDFINTNATRLEVVYVAANDGMLHAFRAKGSATAEAAAAAAAADPIDTDKRAAAEAALAADIAAGVAAGEELWAYIPSMVMPHLYKLADKNYSTKHRYFVDGTPTSGDICVSACGTNAAIWKTILVGGLNRGGRGYYALDVTDPLSPKALWEFTNSNLGYSYGNPVITKLVDGTWVVLLSSGYNNVPNSDGLGGDGKGHLFVVNASNGELIRTISNGVGSDDSPSGFTRISAQVVNPTTDNTVIAVYGGDLHGNLWRFDINNTVGAPGYDAQLLATLRNDDGQSQPITTRPQVGIVDNNTVVYVGTGSFIALSDIADTTGQSIYAIKDPKTDNTDPTVAIYGSPRDSINSSSLSNGFVQQVQQNAGCSNPTSSGGCPVGSPSRTSTNYPVSFSTGSGWFLDLPDPGERINTDLSLDLGLLGFNTNVPNGEACNMGGYSYAYGIDYRTGGAVSSSTSNVIGAKLGNELASRPVYVRLPDGTVVQVTSMSGGSIKTTTPPKPPYSFVTRRTSWRELIEGN